MLSLKQLAPRVKRRLLRYVWQIKCALAPNQTFSFTLPDASRFDYPLKSALGVALFLDHFETAEIAFMRKSLKPGSVVFDIGANAGLFTVIASKQVGAEGHVYAFEPGERELQLLHHNIAVNQLTNVTVIPCAVSNVSGSARFAIARDGAMNSLGQTHHPGQQIERWETIETICLDDFTAQREINQVDFIKIDVEGAERQVIQGSSRLLGPESKTIVMFESYTLNTTGFGYKPAEFLTELAQLGLFLYAVEPDGSFTSLVAPLDKPEFGHLIYSFVTSPAEVKIP